MRCKAVIFDLDNTLYDYDTAHEAAFHALCAYARTTLALPEADFRAVYDEVMREQIQRAGGEYAVIHNRMIRFQMILERLGRPILYAPEMSDLYWSVFLDACRPVSGVRETLETLRGEYVVGVGTNMTADYQFRKLQKLRLLDCIDFMVSSEEVSAEKPDRRIFEACARKAGCAAGDCVFVGDSISHDVRGALGAGMCAVWLFPPSGHPDLSASSGHPNPSAPDTPSVLRIRRLEELPALLRTLSTNTAREIPGATPEPEEMSG